MLAPMLMIAAALEEELETAKSLCSDVTRVRHEKTKLWRAVRNNAAVCLVRTGVGPKRSAGRLQEALAIARPDRILVIGYAGALDPDLKLGGVCAVGKAVELGESPAGWDKVHVEGEFDLAEWPVFEQAAASAGLRAYKGSVVTSSHVLGHPSHKRLLHERFGAVVVDMETAALARVARYEGIPLSCIRVVSDEAEDDFLAPLSYDPSAGISARTMQLLQAGIGGTYRQWKTNSALARDCLRRLLPYCL